MINGLAYQGNFCGRFVTRTGFEQQRAKFDRPRKGYTQNPSPIVSGDPVGNHREHTADRLRRIRGTVVYSP